MDLPVATKPVSDQKASERLALTRLYDQSSNQTANDHAIEALLPHLSKTVHSYKDGQLALLLDDRFLSHSASVVVVAVERMPEIAKKIFFFDTVTHGFRPYDDVIWNIEKNPRRLAALAYKGDAHSSHIIVTPAVRGNNSRDRSSIDCEKIMLSDSPVKGLGMIVRLRARDAFGAATDWQNIDIHRGHRQLVNANDVVISGFDQFELPNPVIYMDIAVRPACARDYLPLATSAPAMHYERTI